MSLPVRLSDWTGIDRDVMRIGALYYMSPSSPTCSSEPGVAATGCAPRAGPAPGSCSTTTWLLPWYLIWVLPLAALSRDRTLKIVVLALTALLLGTRIPL